MKVNINGNTYDYTLDFSPNTWGRQSHDYYMVPVDIGGHACFIKRFDRPTHQIAGWGLLTYLKGKVVVVPNIPQVYDIKRVVEQGKEVHYVFCECIKGKTLEEALNQGLEIAPLDLAQDLYNALRVLFDQGYWFPDFVEKNFMVSDEGKVYLIDIDSAYPVATLPSPANMHGGQEYWSPVYDTYRKELKYQGINSSSLNGIIFNCLQLVFLITHFKYYLDKEEAKTYDVDNLSHLPTYLIDTFPYAASIFRFALGVDKNGRHKQQVPPFEAFISLIRQMFPDGKPIYLVAKVVPPKIVSFKINNQDQTQCTVQAGQNIELSWEVRNATQVLLKPMKQNFNLSGRLSLKPKANARYTLIAINQFKKEQKQVEASIEVKVNQPVLLEPYIQANIHSQKGSLLQEGQTFTLQWSSKNATKVEIDGQTVALNGEAQHSAKLSKKHFRVVAYNQQNGNVKEAVKYVQVNVKKKEIPSKPSTSQSLSAKSDVFPNNAQNTNNTNSSPSPSTILQPKQLANDQGKTVLTDPFDQVRADSSNQKKNRWQKFKSWFVVLAFIGTGAFAWQNGGKQYVKQRFGQISPKDDFQGVFTGKIRHQYEQIPITLSLAIQAQEAQTLSFDYTSNIDTIRGRGEINLANKSIEFSQTCLGKGRFTREVVGNTSFIKLQSFAPGKWGMSK